MSEMVREILTNLGYVVQDRGREFRMRPLYRESDNMTSLCVYKDNGAFVDFSANINGSFEELIRLTLNLTSIDEAKKYLQGIQYDGQIAPNKKPTGLKTIKYYSDDILLRLLPSYDFYLKRGISVETLKKFQVGMAHGGKLRMRLVAPIYEKTGKIYGFWGRWHQEKPPNDTTPKYKIIGPKSEFIYPWHLSSEFIKESKHVILVEGPSDVLWCWENGIKNVLCLFGVKISAPMLKYLISISPVKIIIATNNEPDNNNIGNNAADKIQKTLLKYFDENNVKIHLPSKKDLNDLTQEELKVWFNNI